MELKKSISTLWRCLIIVLIYLSITALVQIGILFIKGANWLDENMLLTTGISSIFIILVFAMIYINKIKIQNTYTKSNATIMTYIICAIGAMGWCLIGSILTSISGISQNDETFQILNETVFKADNMIMILSSGILAPISEELVFRGCIFNIIKRTHKEMIAMIVSAIIFGIIHMNITQGIYAAMLGIILAYAYIVTKTILIPIIMHMSANLISVFITILYASDISAVSLTLIILIMLIVGITMAIYMIIYLSKLHNNSDMSKGMIS